MGPSGAHSLLLEMHTLWFNTLQAQYIKAVFEQVCRHQVESDKIQTMLHAYAAEERILSFGSFSDLQNYAGFVPSEHYLAEMMNKAIESEEHNANQYTACLAPDQLAIDNSHKVCFLVSLFCL